VPDKDDGMGNYWVFMTTQWIMSGCRLAGKRGRINPSGSERYAGSHCGFADPVCDGCSAGASGWSLVVKELL
jgi:hypothetical protein